MPELNDCANLHQRVERMIVDEVLPLLQMDGGRIEVVEVHDGVLRVRLHGTCSSCPATVQAVISGVEEELRRRIPEIEYLEAVP